jgi:hypothetical protein
VRLVGATGSHCDPRYHVEEKEAAFCAISNSLCLSKRRLVASAPILFGCSLTAVAWWFQLSFDNSWEQLMREMAMLAKIAPTTTAPTAALQFAIPSSSNSGQWCGLRCQDPTTHAHFMDIRTFTSDDC